MADTLTLSRRTSKLSVVPYASLEDVQTVIRRFRDLFEPEVAMTPEHKANGWRIRYTRRPTLRRTA